MPDIYWPFDTSMVSEWPGTRPAGWAYHVGTDFAVPQGTPLRATMSGNVDIIWNDGLGAWVIDIIAPDGTVARHGHLSAMYPSDGEWVNAGQVIGATGGALGTPGAGLSTGSHLHWELRNSQAWSGAGWYDPRDLTIKTFASLDAPAKPDTPAPLLGMDNAMLVYYAHAAGKNKGGWLVMGYTPNALIVTAQKTANYWAAHIGKPTQKESYAGFMKYLRAAGGTKAQLDAVYEI